VGWLRKRGAHLPLNSEFAEDLWHEWRLLGAFTDDEDGEPPLAPLAPPPPSSGGSLSSAAAAAAAASHQGVAATSGAAAGPRAADMLETATRVFTYTFSKGGLAHGSGAAAAVAGATGAARASAAAAAVEPVTVLQDIDALSAASTGDAPAWCWRLWPGAIVPHSLTRLTH
jgi:hypothetical protein